MAEGSAKGRPAAAKRNNFLEAVLEFFIFQSRWLMAPLYLGLVGCLVILIGTFFRELYHAVPDLMSMSETKIVLLILTLIDLSLAGNLVLIVIFSGYENFVSKIESAADDPDRPSWMGTLDFSGLKMKLVGSIVAISAIHLLKVFMNLKDYTQHDLIWLVAIHLTFVGSGIGFALMDWIEDLSHRKDHA